MSVISFLCPLCSKPLSAESIYAGKKVLCTHCRQEILIPEQGATPSDDLTGAGEKQATPPEISSSAAASSKTTLIVIAVIVIAIFQLATFILLLYNRNGNSLPPQFYEYKTVSFSRYDRDGFDKKVKELANEGWDFYFETTNYGNSKDIVFRKLK